MNEIEVQILIIDSALESAQQHVVRCKRRLSEARINLEEAEHVVRSLERSIAAKREEYLLRSVV